MIIEEIIKRGHEQVSYFHDPSLGLKGIVAIHNTVLGPALGGCRMWNYASEEEALIDVLRLSKGMTYKAAIAGLNLGGGKAVIIGDPKSDKSEELFRSFGRFIEIKHLNNFKTRYAHLYKFSKNLKKGKLVKQGDIIGYVGTSGRSTGPHLHYEVKHKNRTINPMKLKLESSLNVEDDEMANFYANISLARERFLATKLQETVTADYFYD